MKDAQFIEACIPDSLRLAKHQDAELVNQAIATALLAYREADRAHVWEKNKTAAISRALSAYMESVYVPHISKEEEDWSALQKQAEEARVMKAAQAEIASDMQSAPAMEPVAASDTASPIADNGDKVVTISGVRRTKSVKGHQDGWSFNYGGAASGKGSITYDKDVFGDSTITCEVTDSEDNLMARKSSQFAGSALRKAFKKAGLTLSAMPSFIDSVNDKP